MIQFFTIKILKFFDYFHQKKIINFLLKRNINKFDVVFDIGAHEGETVNLLLNNFVINEIYSFEPSPDTFLILKKKTELIKKKKNTKLFLENFAIGSTNKSVYLKQLKETSSSTINDINENSTYFRKKSFFLKKFDKDKFFNEVEVEQFPLKHYVKKKDIKIIDFLKIDTEGYEYEVLKGAEEILFKIKLILFEHHYDDMIAKNYKFSDINKLLKKNGFLQIYKLKMPFRKTFEYIYVNNNLK